MADDRRTLSVAGSPDRRVTFTFEGEVLEAQQGEPVGVALFAAGTRLLGRSPKFHRPRGLFCLAGHCGSCSLRIDGKPSVRACMTPVHEGLTCERQNALPDADLDVLRAADWLFPEGMDHHHLMTGTGVGNRLFLKLVRQMGGTGTLPDAAPDALPEITEKSVDLCIVGGGPAGLAAARAACTAQPRSRVLLVDEQTAPGGSLLAEPTGTRRGIALAAAATHAGAELWQGSTAIAYYPEDSVTADQHARGILAVVTPTGLVKISALRVLYATGAYDQNLPFPDNDRPGILSARACGRLVFRWGTRPSGQVIIAAAGDPPSYATILARGLGDLGVPVAMAHIDQLPRLRLTRDVLAVAAVPAPASELPRQHGAEVKLDLQKGGFAVTVDGDFLTTVPSAFAAGDVTGYKGADAAEAEGRAAGQSAIGSL